jgi:hypothetical protein
MPYLILRERPDGTLEYNHQIQVNSLIIIDNEWEKGLRESYKEDTMAKTILV